jgi:glycosyltransferase involved in cell wall biosynthesis
MRVLILTNLFPSPWQPHRATFNRQQFAALAKMHDVRVIAPVAWTDRWKSRDDSASERILLREGMTVEYPTYLYPPKVLRSWHGRFFLRSVRPTFERAVEQFQPDVVLASWAYPDGWAAVELARGANLPVVAKVHGSDVLLLDQCSARRAPTAAALARADAVVAVSRQLVSGVQQLGVDSNRIHLVYNGIDTSLFRAGARDEAKSALNLSRDPMVLFIGNLAPVKGLETLIKACAILRSRGVRFTCCMIGQGALRQSLSNQIAATGLEQIVRLLGPRPLEELPRWYQAASVFVLPSRSEGIPNVILEALACGTPVVASRVGGIPEILSESSMVPSGDGRAFAEAIEQVISSSAQSSPSKFRPTSWSESAANLAEVLRTSVEARRRKAA